MIQNKITTAENFLDVFINKHSIPWNQDVEKVYGAINTAMIEFAKLHVKAALEAVSNKAKIIEDPNCYTGNTGSEYPPDQIIDIKSILNAYPEINIV